MKQKRTKKFLLTTAALVTMGLSLAACQTASPVQQQQQNLEEMSKIDAVLMRAANDAQARGKEDESLELLENMYRRNSADTSIATRYARALRYAKRYQRASMVLTPFAQNYAEHENPNVLVEYSALKSAMGDYATAEEYGRKAVAEAPEIARGHHVLGIALDAQGDHKEAETEFRKALDNWQGDPASLLNNLGLNLAAQGQVEEAISILSKAAAASPNRIEIERNLRIVKALRNTPYQLEEEAAIPVPPSKPNAKPVKAETEVEAEAAVSEEAEAVIEEAEAVIEEEVTSEEEAEVEEAVEETADEIEEAAEEVAEETEEAAEEAAEEIEEHSAPPSTRSYND